MDIVSFCAVSITDAEIIITDGKSFELVGVIPDRIVLPTAADLRDGKDPVMVESSGAFGLQVRRAKARLIFPHRMAQVSH